jgi:hypothetical protein
MTLDLSRGLLLSQALDFCRRVQLSQGLGFLEDLFKRVGEASWSLQ